MLGQFQQSSLRIEVDAPQNEIAASLTHGAQVKAWLFPQQFEGLPEQLKVGDRFTSQLALISVTHTVEVCTENSLRLILSGSIDGFHEWSWGDGWVQSRLEGVSLLPLNLGATLSLWRLRQQLESATVETTDD
ncbi:MAG: hypothetical protein AAGG51_07920 [Cyanobacteria bacterium P01_G01_bin.54]